MERTASERKYLVMNARLLLASYRAIPLGTTPNHSFPVRSKTKNHGVTSTLCKFEPSEPRLDLLDRGPLQTSFTVETPLSHFLMLDHTHCHRAAGRN